MNIHENHGTGELSQPSTRRSLLKLAGAAAGGGAIRSLPVKAAGSGDTIDLLPPSRVLDTRNGFGPLTGGNDYSFGPFPALGGFDSTSTTG